MLSQHSAMMAQDYFELAYEMQMHGELDRAMYYYGRSLDCVESPEAYTFMAWAESMRGNFERAIDLCRGHTCREHRSSVVRPRWRGDDQSGNDA